VHLKDIFRFGGGYWCVTITCIMNYMSIFPFLAIASGMFQNRFGHSLRAAGNLVSIPYLISALAPFSGLLMDKIGKRTYFSKNQKNIILVSYVFITVNHVWSFLINIYAKWRQSERYSIISPYSFTCFDWNWANIFFVIHMAFCSVYHHLISSQNITDML
jgi:hypothetical protein